MFIEIEIRDCDSYELFQAFLFWQTITINHTYTVEDIAKVRQKVKKPVLNKAIRLISRDKVFTNGNKAIVVE